MNSPYELVQSALLIGKDCAHSQPAAVAATPPITSPPTARRVGPAPRIPCPPRTPRGGVASAGSVLRTPPGAKNFQNRQRGGPSTRGRTAAHRWPSPPR